MSSIKLSAHFFYDINKPVSDEIADIGLRTEEILKNGFALTATGVYLDNKVTEQGIIRKPATYSSVSVTVTGTPGAYISEGDKVASDTITFTVTETKEINETGNVVVSAICDIPGKIGNVPVGAINRFPVTLSGLVSVINTEAATDGFDEETDDELRRRYFEKVSLPATSGSKYHYVMWAKEVSGVGDAKCLPLWNGNGTVKVIIINSDKGIASKELITEVTQHIEENRPIGAEVTVESAEPLVIDISVSLVLANSADIDTRRGRVMSKLRGTGTVTKTMMKNVAASFVNGDIEIIEYPSEYCFSVKFTSRTGIPYNIADIQAMIEEIKPAHLAVEYIFTYRLWQDIIDTLNNWENVKLYTWDWLLSFEIQMNLNVVGDKVFYCSDNNGNAYVVWNEKRAYARRNE